MRRRIDFGVKHTDAQEGPSESSWKMYSMKKSSYQFQNFFAPE